MGGIGLTFPQCDFDCLHGLLSVAAFSSAHPQYVLVFVQMHATVSKGSLHFAITGEGCFQGGCPATIIVEVANHRAQTGVLLCEVWR